MSAQDFAAVKRALAEARALAGAERHAHFDALAIRDPALAAEVRSLLAHETSDAASDALGDVGARLEAALGNTPERIGAYRVLDVLGEGGMGVVYRAEQAEPRRDVALKVLRTTMATPSEVARFEAEVEALARLDHPHVASVFDAGRAPDGRPWLVMPLVDGVPLTAFCRAHALDVPARLHLFLDVCDAVRHAHQRGIVHRDLKPSNLLVSLRDGRPWPTVIDFGIAKADAGPGDHGLTAVGQVIGTPAYMSPEQAGAHDGIVDTRTDVYALGVVLHELLTGIRPHAFPDTRPEAIREVLTGEHVPRPSTRVDDPAARRTLRGDLDAIVLMALRPDPERRYASVEALADDLRRHLDGLPVRARPERWSYLASRFVRRHRTGVLTGALVAAAAVAGVAVLIAQDLQLREERDRALAAEAEARAEAETTRQVADFLVGVFGLIDPADREGRDMTARELLAAGTASLDEQLQDDPEVRARVLETVADVHLSLGDYDQAQPLAEEALTLRRDLWPDGHADVALSLETLSTLAHDRGDYEAAIARAEEALAMLGRLDHGESTQAATLVNDLAISLDALGRYEEAEVRYRDALARQTALLGEDDPETLWALNTLGQAVFRQGRWAEGATIFADAAERQRALFDGPHPDLAASLNNLGGASILLDDLETAEQALHEALGMYRALYGEDHAAVGRGIHNLARARQLQGHHDEAVARFREAEAIQRQAVGEGHPLHTSVLTYLGEAVARRGESEGAVLLEQALAASTTAVGPDHPRTRTMRAMVAREAWRAGRTAEAAEALDALLAVSPDGDPKTALLRLDRAALAIELGDPVTAHRLLDDTAALDALPDAHWARPYRAGLLARLDGAPTAEAPAALLSVRFTEADPRARFLRGDP